MTSAETTDIKKWLKENKYVVGFDDMRKQKLASTSGTGNEAKDGRSELVENTEKSQGTLKQRPQGRIKRHFRRFWFCYVLASIVLLAIFLPLFFIYAFPAIAQLMVKNAKLHVYSASLLSPTPSGITISLNAGFEIPAGIKVRLDPITLSLFNRNVTPIVPYIDVALPTEIFEGKAEIQIANQTVDILDQDQFVDFLNVAVYQKTFTMSAKGSTTAHVGALKAKLTLDKDVELNGLWALNGFSIKSAALVANQSDGSNLQASAVLPNYSLVTFALGNVTLNLQAAGITLGESVIDNVVLTPGNNTVSLRGTISIQTVLDNLLTIVTAEKSDILNGVLALSASGNSTVYDGNHIVYFERVLDGLVISTEISIISVLSNTISGLLSNDTTISSALSGLLNGTVDESAYGKEISQLVKAIEDRIATLNV